MAKDLAIILNNGSVNSAAATALAVQKHRPIMLYAETSPQQPAPGLNGSRMRTGYDLQVAHFKPHREHTLSMPFLSAVVAPPHHDARATDPRSPAQVTPRLQELLPLIAAAARYAMHYDAASIYLGLRIGQGSDELAQATEYVQIWNELIQLPCQHPELEIVAPLLELEAWQVIDVGLQVGAPLDRTWSCMEEGTEPCWACRGCRAREQAFQQAGKPDPLRVVRKI